MVRQASKLRLNANAQYPPDGSRGKGATRIPLPRDEEATRDADCPIRARGGWQAADDDCAYVDCEILDTGEHRANDDFSRRRQDGRKLENGREETKPNDIVIVMNGGQK